MIRRPERLKWIQECNKLPDRPPTITIGKDTQIDSTVKLGEESYSMERNEDGAWLRCKQLGDVLIGDNVHISPYSIIRRATLPNHTTEIGDGTKISAFVNIGHNAKVGKHVFIGPLVNIDGSVEVGDYSYIAPQVQVNSHVKIGAGAFIGAGATVTEDVAPNETAIGTPAKPIGHWGNKIDSSFKHGENFKIGKSCVIDPDVVVGDNVTLGHFITLKSGTRFGNNVDFADYCKTTGLCYLGNNVNVRTDTCISKSVIVEDCVFIGPGVMTNHTKHVHHMRPQVEKRQLITRIGYGVIIGSCSSLIAGVTIGDNAILGANCGVYKDVLGLVTYVGDPVRPLKPVPEVYIIEKPEDYKEHVFPIELLEKYLPHVVGNLARELQK